MKRIIIVDDDPAMQDAFGLVFNPNEYQVTILSSGKTILDLTFEMPDLFILDKQLSGVNGLEICQFLKSQPATQSIPVIMLSASPDIRRMAMSSGASDALEKPFKMNVLRNMVARCIEASAVKYS